jgi:hypothetical protein
MCMSFLFQGLECSRCGSVPDQCFLSVNSVTLNGTEIWRANEPATAAAPLIFAETSSLTSSYLSGTQSSVFNLKVQQDLAAELRMTVEFMINNDDCGKAPSSKMTIAAIASGGAEQRSLMSVPPRNISLGEGRWAFRMSFRLSVRQYLLSSIAALTHVFLRLWQAGDSRCS